MLGIRNIGWFDDTADWEWYDKWVAEHGELYRWSTPARLVQYLWASMPIKFEVRKLNLEQIELHNVRLDTHTRYNVWKTGPRQPTKHLNWQQWCLVNVFVDKFFTMTNIPATVTTLGGRLVIREGYTSYSPTDWKRQIGYELVGPNKETQLERWDALIPCDCKACSKKGVFA